MPSGSCQRRVCSNFRIQAGNKFFPREKAVIPKAPCLPEHWYRRARPDSNQRLDYVLTARLRRLGGQAPPVLPARSFSETYILVVNKAQPHSEPDLKQSGVQLNRPAPEEPPVCRFCEIQNPSPEAESRSTPKSASRGYRESPSTCMFPPTNGTACSLPPVYHLLHR
jgi:hypothetical protein